MRALGNEAYYSLLQKA